MVTFKARARALDMLGRQQIAGIPTAISELFKNAHDAYADRVVVDYFRNESLLVLRDDGVGMSGKDFEDRWLTIGTESKLGQSGLAPPPIDPNKPRRATLGEKGTYQILKKFPARLDSGFVTHKVLQNPEDASAHLLPLVVSEIQSALEDNVVVEVLSEPALAAWLDSKVVSGFVFGMQGVTEEQAKNGVQQLLKRPLLDVAGDPEQTTFSQGFLKSKGKARGEVAGRLTEVLSGEPGHLANQEFALLMSVRSRYGTPPPKLALGTIVHDLSRAIYLLCVQPRCDSVRLTGERQFPFLPLSAVSAGYDHVVSHGAGIVTLQLIDEPYRIEMISFQPWPGVDREVLAKGLGDQLFFKSGDREATFQWVAELRTEHAQRIANLLASKISRVGLNESEWLRLSAKNKED